MCMSNIPKDTGGLCRRKRAQSWYMLGYIIAFALGVVSAVIVWLLSGGVGYNPLSLIGG